MDRRVLKWKAPAIVLAIGYIGVIIGVITNEEKNSFVQPQNISLPTSLASLPLVSSSDGQTAIAEVMSLHKKEFPLTSGAIGVYGENAEVKLWVTGATSVATASSLVDAMRYAISEGDSPFQPIDEISQQGRKLYLLTGIGQIHYYFQSGSYVIWLAVEHDLSDRVLSKVLEFYP